MRARGHTLLEAIVALALLSGTALVALTWMQTSLRQLDRALEREAEARLLANAHSLAAGLDFLARPSGTEQVAGVNLQWTSRPEVSREVLPPQSTEFGGGWQLSLIRVSVVAESRSDDRALKVSFELVHPVPRLLAGKERS